jgi:opacity protein-like surface antigen
MAIFSPLKELTMRLLAKSCVSFWALAWPALAALALATVLASPAQAVNGLYVGLKFGTGITQADKTIGGDSFSGFGAFAGASGNFPFSWNLGSGAEAGFLAGLNDGYDFEKSFSLPIRVELDYTYRFGREETWQNRFPITGLGNVNFFDASYRSKIQLQTLLINFWYDIPTGTKLTPYIGGGVGLAIVKVKASGVITPELFLSGPFSDSKTKTNFAWSLGLGLGYDITDHLTLDLGYRFVYAGKVGLDHVSSFGSIAGPANGITVPVHALFKKLISHDITLGIRYTF